MDDKKLVKLFNFVDEKKEKPEVKKASSFSHHTNPIIQRMLLCNLESKKDKFKFKDLFR